MKSDDFNSAAIDVVADVRPERVNHRLTDLIPFPRFHFSSFTMCF